MESHPDFKFKSGDVVVPKKGVEVPDYMQEITITDVRPAHYEYKAKDKDGDICKLSPKGLEANFELKA